MPEIRIELDDKDIKRKLQELARKTGNLVPALKRIGEYMLRVTEDRFKKEQAPDGSKWKDVRPSTRAKKKHPKILTESGHLRGSIRYQLQGKDTLAVGTNVPYGAIHQLGGKTPARIITARVKKALYWRGARHPVKSVKHPGSVFPARPFLGIGKEDKEEVLNIVNDYLLARR